MNKSEKQLRKIIRETISNILNPKLEAKDPFVPTYGKGNVVHDCPKHVQEMKSGKKGKVVNHSLNESGEVNYVDVDFGTGKIFENIPTKKLKVLESHVHEHQVKEEPTKKLSEGNTYYDLKRQYYEISDNVEGALESLMDIKKKRDTDTLDKIGGVDGEIKIWMAILKLFNKSKLGKVL